VVPPGIVTLVVAVAAKDAANDTTLVSKAFRNSTLMEPSETPEEDQDTGTEPPATTVKGVTGARSVSVGACVIVNDGDCVVLKLASDDVITSTKEARDAKERDAVLIAGGLNKSESLESHLLLLSHIDLSWEAY
jgi:hypothetical protein